MAQEEADLLNELRQRAADLERRVQALEEENAALAEGREDAVLLGLVAEQIQEQSQVPEILRAALERISILKDIPLCVCLSQEGRHAAVLESYANFTDQWPAQATLAFSPRLAEQLRQDSQILAHDECAEAGLSSSGLFPFAARGALLIPFRSRAIANGVLLFADDRGARRLERNAAFLHRFCDGLVARLDNVALLGALRDVAGELERKVRERTQDLADRNFALMREVAERQHAEDALRESEEKFRIAFTTSPDAININRLDDGSCLAINEGFARITGWSAAEVIGRSSLDLSIWVDPADRARLVAALKEEGSVENLEAQFRCKDGRVCDGLMSARVIQLGGQSCILSVTRDVTALKRAQSERDRLAAQLGQARKMEAIGRLAGGVAHDFNNLLTVIVSCAEVMKRDAAAGGSANLGDIEEILAAGQRAGELTRHLLAFARKQPIAPVPLDLNVVVKNNERLLRRVLGEDVELVVDVEDALWPVRCDPGQMEQVLLNLAVNARDAMPEGGMLTIRTRNAESVTPGHARQWVRLSVRDSGKGMSAEVMAHLFEPFFTTKPPGHGTGLGLATVHGVVAQSGGHIQAQSEPGSGSVFEIYLPRAPASATGVSESGPVEMRQGEGGHETVLVVEDDASVRRVTCRTLEDAGYRVLAASSGGEALKIAQGEPRRLDLVVTDIVMPGMGGRAVAERLREMDNHIRVLFVSGYPQDGTEPEGLFEQGMVFLPKPFTPGALLARVRALLDGTA